MSPRPPELLDPVEAPSMPSSKDAAPPPPRAGPPFRRLPERVWWALLGVAVLAGVIAGLVDSDTEVAVGVTVFLAFLVLPLRMPIEAVLVFFAVSWFPFERVFGAEKTLFAFAGGINTSGLRLLGAFIGLAIAAYLLRDRLRAVSLPRWLAAGLVLYLALVVWALVTTAWTPDRIDGLRGVTKLLFPVLVAAVIVADPKDWGAEKMTKAVLWVFTAGLAAATIFGFFDLMPTDDPGEIAEIWAWSGISSHAFYAGIVAVVGVALLDNGFRRAGWAAALAILQLPFTVSRVAIGATGVAITAMLAISGVRRWLAPIGVIAVAAIFLWFPPIVDRNVYEVPPPEAELAPGSNPTVGAVQEAFTDPLNLPSFIRFEGREQLWEDALGRMSGIDWAIGNGINAWNSLSEGLPYLGGAQLHGEYVRLIYEMGAIGLILALLAYGVLFAGFVRLGLRAHRHTIARATATAAIGLIALYLLTATTDNTLDYYVVGSYVWAGLALAVLAGAASRSEQTG